MDKVLNGEILKVQAKCRFQAAENNYNAAKHLVERDDFSLTTLMGFLNGAKTHLQKSIEYTNRLIAEFSDVFNKEDLKRNLQNIKDNLEEVDKIINEISEKIS